MTASASDGRISGPIGVWLSARGATRASRKNVCEPAQIDNAGANVLNARRRGGSCRLHDRRNVLAAMVTAAGPGPKSSAEVMKNVSATDMLAEIEDMLILNDPVRIASAASSSQAVG